MSLTKALKWFLDRPLPCHLIILHIVLAVVIVGAVLHYFHKLDEQCSAASATGQPGEVVVFANVRCIREGNGRWAFEFDKADGGSGGK